MKITLTHNELSRLLNILRYEDKKLYEKICQSNTKYSNNNRKRLLRLYHTIKKNKDTDTVTIPNWLFEKPIGEGIEELTIDVVRRLHGMDRVRVLKSYHEWKQRQKHTDAIMLRNQEQRIRQFLLKNNAPEKYQELLEKKKKYRYPKKKTPSKKSLKAKKYYIQHREEILLKLKQKRAQGGGDKDGVEERNNEG